MAENAERAVAVCPACGSPRPDYLASGLCVSCLSVRFGPEGARSAAAGADTSAGLPPGFERLEILGRGGMGIVFLAFQRSLSRYVALKQLAGNWQGNPKAQERFLREARAAASLSHPGIVPILEIGTHAGGFWYTMEYLVGGDLSETMARQGGSLSWDEAASILVKVAEAIQFAHEAGVAHRDLKPSNILMAQGNVPKVCDFGLAWVAGREAIDLTATGEIIGTPAYLAPEVVSGASRTGDARISDIYSLGAVLFHVVSGRPPFQGSHPLEILGAIVNNPAPRLSESLTRGSVPATLDQICAKCLEKRPEDRFRSAKELAAALKACLEQKPSLFQSFRLRRRTRRRLLAAAIAAAIALGIYFNRSKFTANEAQAASLGATAPLMAIMAPEALGKDDESVLLAQGLQDELVSTLTRISNVRVLATRSVRAASANGGDFRSAQGLLGASVVLTSTVQKSQDMFRISVQMIDAGSGTTIWSDRFDRHETNILNLQTDIATQVALHLDARLRPGQAKLALGIASGDPAAERLFLKARAALNDASASVADLDRAAELLKQAVRADPQFALAYALLSNVDTQMYSWGNDRTDERLGLSMEAAQQAFKLNPNLPEAEIALGNYFFRGSKDYVTARPHFDRALELSPNDPEALAALAYVERRQGSFKEAAQNLKAALKLDPLNPVLAYNTADTFLRLREYDEASGLLEHSLKLMPESVPLLKLRGDLYVSWKGDPGPMGEEVTHRDPKLPTPDFYVLDRVEWLTLVHRLDEALAVLRGSDFRSVKGQSIYLSRDGYEALLLDTKGDVEASRRAASLALPSLEKELERNPNDPRILLHLGQVSAILGNKEKGERLARRTLTPGDPACADAFDRGFYLRSLAILLALTGQDEKARETIRDLLADPNQYSALSLALHPALQRFFK